MRPKASPKPPKSNQRTDQKGMGHRAPHLPKRPKKSGAPGAPPTKTTKREWGTGCPTHNTPPQGRSKRALEPSKPARGRRKAAPRASQERPKNVQGCPQRFQSEQRRSRSAPRAPRRKKNEKTSQRIDTPTCRHQHDILKGGDLQGRRPRGAQEAPRGSQEISKREL